MHVQLLKASGVYYLVLPPALMRTAKLTPIYADLRRSYNLRKAIILNLIGYLFLIGMFLIQSCSPVVSVNTDYDSNAAFNQFRSWNWYQAKPAADRENDKFGNYDTFLDRRIRNAINNEFNKKAFTQTSTNPDILVAYDVSIERKQEMDPGFAYAPGFGWGYGYWYGYRYNYGFNRFPNYNMVQEYNEGTVVIDIVSARDNQLIWRGWGQARVSAGGISESEVNRIVKEIMEEYPPKK